MLHIYLVSIFCFFSKICNCPPGPITHCDFILSSCYAAVLYNFRVSGLPGCIPNSVTFLTLTCSAIQMKISVFLWMDPACVIALQEILVTIVIYLSANNYLFFWQLYHVYFSITMETLNFLSPNIDSSRILLEMLSQSEIISVSIFSDVHLIFNV